MGKNGGFLLGTISYQWESGKSFANWDFKGIIIINHLSSIYIYRRFCIATFDYVLEGKGELFISMHCELWFGSSCDDLARQDLCLCALLTLGKVFSRVCFCRVVSLELRKSCLSPKARIVQRLLFSLLSSSPVSFGHQTWLARKSGRNGGFHGKIT